MGIADVLVAGIGGVTVVTIAALRLARFEIARLPEAPEFRRCPALKDFPYKGRTVGCRCDYAEHHDGPHHLAETATTRELWWPND